MIMKIIRVLLTTIVISCIPFPPLFGQQLDEHLLLLEPLTNKTWQAEMPRLGQDVMRECRWDVIWEGKAVKQILTIKKIHFVTEAYFFWDSDKLEIGMFSISSNGNFLHGHVKEENGKILMYGFATFPNEKIEFRNSFELTEEGELLDQWYRFQEGEWKPGHSFLLSEKKEVVPL